MYHVHRLVTLLVLAAAACSQPSEPRIYEVRGQILSINSERQEVIVDHEDIEGFMPAMVMPYTVQDARLLDGKEPGDLVTGTLVVEEINAYLSTLTSTGHAPIQAPEAVPLITDADMLKDGDLVPDYPLVDQSGTPRPIGSLKGHRIALTFIYTRCPLPNFCPLMDKQFAEVQQEIRRSPDLGDVRLVSVTLDPEFDTPAVLDAHARTLGADADLWHFVTGDPNEVIAFARRFGVIAEPGKLNMLVHNLRTALIDPRGRLVTTYSGNIWSPAEPVADLTTIPSPTR